MLHTNKNYYDIFFVNVFDSMKTNQLSLMDVLVNKSSITKRALSLFAGVFARAISPEKASKWAVQKLTTAISNYKGRFHDIFNDVYIVRADYGYYVKFNDDVDAHKVYEKIIFPNKNYDEVEKKNFTVASKSNDSKPYNNLAQYFRKNGSELSLFTFIQNKSYARPTLFTEGLRGRVAYIFANAITSDITMVKHYADLILKCKQPNILMRHVKLRKTSNGTYVAKFYGDRDMLANLLEEWVSNQDEAETPTTETPSTPEATPSVTEDAQTQTTQQSTETASESANPESESTEVDTSIESVSEPEGDEEPTSAKSSKPLSESSIDEILAELRSRGLGGEITLRF